MWLGIEFLGPEDRLELPPPVEKSFRKALALPADPSNEPEFARLYQDTLELSEKHGMHSQYPPVVSFHMAFQDWMERAGFLDVAIQYQEVIRDHCQDFLEASVKGGRLFEETLAPGAANDPDFMEAIDFWRCRLRAKIVAMNLNLGRLYTLTRVTFPDKAEKAEKNFESALAEVAKEVKRREIEGSEHVKRVKEGLWLEDEELGAAFEGT